MASSWSQDNSGKRKASTPSLNGFDSLTNLDLQLSAAHISPDRDPRRKHVRTELGAPAAGASTAGASSAGASSAGASSAGASSAGASSAGASSAGASTGAPSGGPFSAGATSAGATSARATSARAFSARASTAGAASAGAASAGAASAWALAAGTTTAGATAASSLNSESLRQAWMNLILSSGVPANHTSSAAVGATIGAAIGASFGAQVPEGMLREVGPSEEIINGLRDTLLGRAATDEAITAGDPVVKKAVLDRLTKYVGGNVDGLADLRHALIGLVEAARERPGTAITPDVWRQLELGVTISLPQSNAERQLANDVRQYMENLRVPQAPANTQLPQLRGGSNATTQTDAGRQLHNESIRDVRPPTTPQMATRRSETNVPTHRDAERQLLDRSSRVAQPSANAGPSGRRVNARGTPRPPPSAPQTSRGIGKPPTHASTQRPVANHRGHSTHVGPNTPVIPTPIVDMLWGATNLTTFDNRKEIGPTIIKALTERGERMKDKHWTFLVVIDGEVWNYDFKKDFFQGKIAGFYSRGMKPEDIRQRLEYALRPLFHANKGMFPELYRQVDRNLTRG
ncbi:hypothetical protein K402DRAFT_397628 [Aulographum hederae CBS 113979]|uniref:Uncharacterized protein n=1 Tax=Aulographum hederae CBS 113979 TaxID=1176131 RepID=A0A6G1GN23_9PEZI|nr:hypothetical protein K402DRAFT_397628 [Aulographum hederae CBS 113979]